MKITILFITLVLFSGCLTVTQPHIAQYRINPVILVEAFEESSYKNMSLKVRQVFAQSSLMSQKMKYAQGKYKEYVFTESEWALSPNKAITQEILKSVRKSKLFSSVHSFKSRSHSDFTLESGVENFMQYFSEDEKKSYVIVTVSMTLINNKSGKTIDSILISKKIDTQTNNAQGGVYALNIVLSEVLTEGIQWLSVVCK